MQCQILSAGLWSHQEPIMTKEWGAVRTFVEKVIVPAGAVLVVLAFFFGGITYIIRAEVGDIRGDVSNLKDNVKTLTDDSKGTNQRIDTLLKDALERAWPRAVASKADVHASLERARSILRLAEDQNIKMEPQNIQRPGLDVLELVNSKRPDISQQDWQSVNDVLGYYSIVNADPKFVAEMETHSWVWRLTNRSEDCLHFQPGANHYGFSTVTIENCTLRLTKALEQAAVFHDVVFKDVTVIYEGGHLLLDRVAFVNCTFQLPLNDKGKKFGETLLAENKIMHLELR
jgi:hypothetical protein